MSWESPALWAKSELFFQHAFEMRRDDPIFGLWAAMGLELLARAAIASFSPTLLADPDQAQQNILHALNLGSMKGPRKSIGAQKVVSLCKTLIAKFTDEDVKAANALINCRNDELHSGSCAFIEYSTQKWIVGFYRCCKTLSNQLGFTLEDLFGAEEAETAEAVLSNSMADVRTAVLDRISQHKKQFEEKEVGEQKLLFESNRVAMIQLSYMRNHKTKCPACGGLARMQGDPFGPERRSDEDEQIIIRQSVLPKSFDCDNCSLSLSKYGELLAAGMGDPYTRTSSYLPSEFYDLFDSDDVEEIVSQRMSDTEHEYDNE